MPIALRIIKLKQHTGRNSNAHKERIAQAQKEHQHEYYEQYAKYDAVFQFGDLIARLIALVVGDRYLQI